MLELNLPIFSHKMRKEGGKLSILDEFRKKYVVLTPEEWVRQNFLHYLVSVFDYPRGLIGNEVSLVLNGMNRRCDSIVYDRQGVPLLIIEYKAPHVPIDQSVIDQIGRYNIVLGVDHLIVTNGMIHYCFSKVGDRYEVSSEIPLYRDLLGRD